MGLAPYGKPVYETIKENLINIADDGSFQLDMTFLIMLLAYNDK